MRKGFPGRLRIGRDVQEWLARYPRTEEREIGVRRTKVDSPVGRRRGDLGHLPQSSGRNMSANERGGVQELSVKWCSRSPRRRRRRRRCE